MARGYFTAALGMVFVMAMAGCTASGSGIAQSPPMTRSPSADPTPSAPVTPTTTTTTATGSVPSASTTRGTNPPVPIASLSTPTTTTTTTTALLPTVTRLPVRVSPTVPPPGTPTDVPVPKVIRSGTTEPRISASPTVISGEVRYQDGVELKIADVQFDEETEDGPGRFPGREFALFSLEITNGSDREFSLDTVVVTVLDQSGAAVAPVFVEGADVEDFAGQLPPDARVNARYAFAVPSSSHDMVTVVVDFDDVHSSAVFRGGLG